MCSVEGMANHAVKFFAHDLELLNHVSRRIMRSLELGEGVLIIATRLHILSIRSFLNTSGLALEPYLKDGQILFCDAEQTLNRFMLEHHPDPQLFQKTVQSALVQMEQTFPNIFAYDEMVSILWDRGLKETTVELEKAWKGILPQHDLFLLCGYKARSFKNDNRGLETILALHTHEEPEHPASPL